MYKLRKLESMGSKGNLSYRHAPLPDLPRGWVVPVALDAHELQTAARTMPKAPSQ
jgi:hypothetical protein